MRWARLVATTLVGLSLAMAGGAMFLIATELSWTRALVVLAGLLALGVLTSVLGLVVTRRVPHNVTGPLLSTVGGLTAFFAGRDVYYRTWLHDPSSVPLDTRVVAFLDESAWWLFAAIAMLLLFFPTGWLPSPRWRPVPFLVVGMALVVHLTGPWETIEFTPPMDKVPRPYGGYPLPVEILSNVANVLLIGLTLACGASLFVRFRRSVGAERAQLKWLSLAGFGLALYPIVCITQIILTGGTDTVAVVMGIVALTALPLSVTTAMLRHRLYDVDRVIADTVSYSIVVVALVAAYAVTSLTLGVLVGQGSAFAAAGATAICALLLAPLRSRLRRTVDQRLFPPRRAALQAIDDLQRRVHTQGAQPEELEQVLRTALRDDHLRIGLLVPGESGFADVRGVPVPDTGLVPITLGDVQIGVITASEETPPAVLRLVATAAASLVEVTRLRAELAGALREVEASRTRLVQVGDAERRRLERDLHDGAQQRLVSLGMAMRLAQRHLPTGDVDVDRLLDQAVAELATAIAELRQIAHGLRPTSLDDGLHAALAALTSKLPIPVRLDVEPDEIGDDVATTAYFVAAEAITNAAKYAQASEITVRVAQGDSGLRIRVQDDGVGGARARNGSGLSGLADRVAAIGGSLLMTSPVGSGTTVEAVLPCES
jgi:signal transduction histidine kinase